MASLAPVIGRVIGVAGGPGERHCTFRINIVLAGAGLLVPAGTHRFTVVT